MNRAVALVLLLGGLIAAPGCSRTCQPAVHDGWIRQGPPSMPMRAGFGTIVNDCPAPLVITGASSAGFADVSLHETTEVDGVSRMRPLVELTVPAEGEAVLQPGGLHLMLADPRAELVAGQSLAIDFALRDGGTLRGEFEVR